MVSLHPRRWFAPWRSLTGWLWNASFLRVP